MNINELAIKAVELDKTKANGLSDRVSMVCKAVETPVGMTLGQAKDYYETLTDKVFEKAAELALVEVLS